jgi:hypothetical protein
MFLFRFGWKNPNSKDVDFVLPPEWLLGLDLGASLEV